MLSAEISYNPHQDTLVRVFTFYTPFLCRKELQPCRHSALLQDLLSS
jgi:hypothetical protein